MKINMKRFIHYTSIPLLAIGLLLIGSCTNTSTKPDESQVVVMDSVSKDLETATKELEDKNAKLEASLEKLDKEFETAK